MTFNEVPVGKIVVSTRLLQLLTDAELEFVLAHERVHIWRRHLVASISFVFVRAVLDKEARRDLILRAFLLMWDPFKVGLFATGDLPPDAASPEANEEEADFWAVSLTGNRDAAHSALKRLVGGDISVPSHTWEIFKTQVPAMTVRQRLATLDANLCRCRLLLGLRREPRRGTFVSTPCVRVPVPEKKSTTPAATGGRSYADRDLKLLWGRAAARCSHPECRKPVTADATALDRTAVLGKVCHIIAHGNRGPRCNLAFPVDLRDKYENLILLCGDHHTLIDEQENTYTVDVVGAGRRRTSGG